MTEVLPKLDDVRHKEFLIKSMMQHENDVALSSNAFRRRLNVAFYQ